MLDQSAHSKDQRVQACSAGIEFTAVAAAGVVDGRPHPVSQIAAAIDRRRGGLSFVMCTLR